MKSPPPSTPCRAVSPNVCSHDRPAVGRNVIRFHPGDEVFGELSRCGFGAYAEFAAAPEQALALKPANLSFEEAATIPTAGLKALQGLRKGRIQPAQRVLINGASGGVGTFAVQLAKSFGPLLSMGRRKFGNLLMKPNQSDLLLLKELCESGKVRPVIDRRFPLSDVPAAVRYIEDGHARGKVVITV